MTLYKINKCISLAFQKRITFVRQPQFPVTVHVLHGIRDCRSGYIHNVHVKKTYKRYKMVLCYAGTRHAEGYAAYRGRFAVEYIFSRVVGRTGQPVYQVFQYS